MATSRGDGSGFCGGVSFTPEGSEGRSFQETEAGSASAAISGASPRLSGRRHRRDERERPRLPEPKKIVPNPRGGAGNIGGSVGRNRNVSFWGGRHPDSLR